MTSDKSSPMFSRKLILALALFSNEASHVAAFNGKAGSAASAASASPRVGRSRLPEKVHVTQASGTSYAPWASPSTASRTSAPTLEKPANLFGGAFGEGAAFTADDAARLQKSKEENAAFLSGKSYMPDGNWGPGASSTVNTICFLGCSLNHDHRASFLSELFHCMQVSFSSSHPSIYIVRKCKTNSRSSPTMKSAAPAAPVASFKAPMSFATSAPAPATSSSSSGQSYMPTGNWGPGASNASPAPAAPVASFKAPMSFATSAPAPATSSASSSGGRSYMPTGNWGPGASSASPAPAAPVASFSAPMPAAPTPPTWGGAPSAPSSSTSGGKSYSPFGGDWGKSASPAPAAPVASSYSAPASAAPTSSSWSSSSSSSKSYWP